MEMLKVVPDGYRAVLGLEAYVREHLPPTVLKLVKIRASMINGCGFCVDMHTREATAAGESQRRLFSLAAWWEAPWFDDRERAALALTDAVTRLGEYGVPDNVYDAAVEAWSEEEVANLILAIATINVWNRISVTTRKAPPPA
jgi:AhpD family alkylhydroperoxidase